LRRPIPRGAGSVSDDQHRGGFGDDLAAFELSQMSDSSCSTRHNLNVSERTRKRLFHGAT